MALNDWSVVSETPVTPSAPAATGWDVVSEAPIQRAAPVAAQPAPTTPPTTTAPPAKAAPEKGSQFLSEFGKGAVRAAKFDLPSLYEQAGVIKDIGALTTVQNRLDLFGKIDKGEITDFDQLRGLDLTTSQARSYLASDPATRQKIRERALNEVAKRKDFVNAAIKTVQAYQQDAKQYAPAVEKASQIGSLTDFTNWLGSNMGSGAVQMAPMILAAATTGGVGLVGMSAAMGVGEAVGDRLKFLANSTKDLPPEKRSDAIVKYLQDTGDVTLTTGIISGLFDAALGPEASFVKKAASNILKTKTRTEAVKEAAKQVPKKIAGEGITGGAQQATQVAGAVRLKEKPEFFTKENIVDILDAAAAEAAGATVGAGIPVGMAAVSKPEGEAPPTPPAPPAPRVEPTLDTGAAPPPTTERAEPTLTGEELTAPTPPEPAWEVTGETPAPTTERAEPRLEPLNLNLPSLPEALKPSDPMALRNEQREAKIAEYAKYMPEEDARRVVMDEERAAEESTAQPPATPADANAQRLQTLILERIDAGVPPQQAAIDAAKQLSQETQADQEAALEAQGEQDVGKSVATAGGEGAGVAGVTPAKPATGGLAGTKRDGVVPTGTDVGGATAREAAQPSTVTRFPAVKDIPGVGVGPTVVKPRAIAESKPLYHETNAEGLNDLLRSDQDVSYTPIFVADNKDIAIGQGANKGVFVTFRPDSLSGQENVKPGTGDIAGREYKTDIAAPRAVAAVEMSQQDFNKLSGLSKRQLQGFDRTDLGNGRLLFTRKELSVSEPFVSTDSVVAPAPAPAPAPAAPAGKRGRKPLPPEQKAQAEERRKEQRRAANAADREVTRMEEELAAAKEELDPSDFPDETQFSEAKISQGMRRKRALAALYDFSRTNKNKPGQRAKAALEAEATAKEIEDIAKGYTLRKQAARKISPSQKNESLATEPVNERYSGTTTGLQAIGVLLRTGTIFQKFVAARIRNAVRSVKVVVLEKDDALPAQLTTEMARSYWDTARALYIYSDAEGTHTVYLRGASFGRDQGINNVTVLHELLHAATSQKIQLALRLMAKGLDSNAPLVKAVQDLRSTMSAAADQFVKLYNMGRLPKDVAELYADSEGAIFADVREFVSYGMTDIGFQRFLNNVSDVIEPSETFFSRFVDAIRNLFGVPEDMHTAMTNLVNATDKIIAASKTDRMRIMEANDRTPAKVSQKQRISPQDKRTLNEIDEETNEALEKFQKSKTAEEAAESVGFLHSLRRWDDLKRYFNSIFKTVDAARLSTLLTPSPTDVVANWGSMYIPELKNTNNLLIDMRNMQHQLVSGAAEVSDSMVRAIKEDPSLFDKLAEVMSVATDIRVDPDVDPRSPKLTKLFADLGPEGQRVYREVRDYNVRMLQLYTSLLDAQIQDTNLSPEAKNALMAQIKKQFETEKKITPYFAFVRNRGPYWLRVRLGSAPSEFYMLGSIVERDAVAAKIAEQQGKTAEEMYSDGEFDSGDSIESLRRTGDTIGLSDALKSIFGVIDNMKDVGPAEKENVKNSVYELYLMTMPEQSFRKSFIARKDTVGYSTDVVRAFSTSALRFANQIPRIKYSQKLRNSLTAGRKSLEGNPDKPKLERFVNEMDKRVGEELSPNVAKGGWESAVDFATRLSFIHYLSSAGSAIIQGVGLLYGASTLGARHGYAATALELGKIMRIWGEFSVIKRNPDGSVTIKPPSIALSKRVDASPMERRAIREVFGAITEPTLSSEILGRGRVSTAKFEGRGSAIGRGFNTVVGGLFHTIERLTRETIFATSFRLSLAEGKKKNLSGDDLFNYAKQQAIADVYDSVGNLSQENRAPMFRGAAGRFLLQFLHQPIFITIRWMQEFKRMLPFMGNEAKFQAFKEFAGIMGTTYLLGGVVALPFAKEMAGFIAAAFDDWDDKDKPEDMRKLSYWAWWSTVWLPEHLGKVGIFGKSLEELTSLNPTELAAVITRGPTNAITGRDISSRVSINPTDMLFGPGKETRTTREGAIALAVDRAGPTSNLILSYMDAYDAWQNGDTQKTIEKLLPAVARNIAVAEKYRKEGVKDYKGNELISADSYTKGDYLYQLIGLRPDNLANHQNVLFELSKGENKIRFERESIIRNIREATLKSDIGRLQKMTERQNKFNARYPEYEVTQENIDRSIDMSIDELSESFKGFRPTEKNERIFAPTAIKSGRALVESQEKKSK